jgi:hypothetical protein
VPPAPASERSALLPFPHDAAERAAAAINKFLTIVFMAIILIQAKSRLLIFTGYEKVVTNLLK